MLVPFLIDPEALPMSQDSDMARKGSVYQRLLDLWGRFGVLIIPERQIAGCELAVSVESLPIRFRKKWQEALKLKRTACVAVTRSSAEMFSTLESMEELSAHARLACVEDVKAVVFGMSEDEHSTYLKESGLELCRIDCVDQANEFTKAAAIALKPITAGENITQLWHDRFKLLTTISRQIVVVDRYAAESHLERRDGRSGLRWLLRALAQDGRKHTINLYSSYKNSSVDDIERSLQEIQIDSGQIQAFYAHLSSDHDFSSQYHARYLRCDDLVCRIDTGLEVFQGDLVYRDTDFSLSWDIKERRNIESKLRDISDSRKII